MQSSCIMENGEEYNMTIDSVRQREFPALFGQTYLDHAGTTLVARSQLEAHHRDIISNLYGNPHSRSPSSQLTTDTIDQVRYRILQYFNTSPDEYTVIFTSGCTGAVKLLAESFDFHNNHCSCCHGNNKLDESKGDGNVKDTVETESAISDATEHRGQALNKDDSNNDYHCSCSSGKGCQQNCPCGCYSNFSTNVKCKRGSFIYLLDNHTSVQGMREIAFERAGHVSCVDCDKDAISKEHVVYYSDHYESGGNTLFAYPAQSNFSGHKYPMGWISHVQNGKLGRLTLNEGQGCCYVLLDAACLVSTSPLDLGQYKPDFVTLSFYKMFGYPTGLGALLVLNKSSHVLKKTYYGGGTVSVSLSAQRFHVLRPALAERFEDGTVSFLDIISLRHGFQTLESLAGGISSISLHTFSVARYFFKSLRALHHGNGRALAEVYCQDDFEDPDTQGAIVTFNLLRANGDYTGFSEVDKLAQLHNIHFRTGCFCNLGACQKFLNISDDELKNNFDAGHVCGDDRDLINGRPTGAVRVSFGYMSTLEDAKICLQFLVDCFLENPEKPVFVEKDRGNHSSQTEKEDILNQSGSLSISSITEEKQSVSHSASVTKELVNHSAVLDKSKTHKMAQKSKDEQSAKEFAVTETTISESVHCEISVPNNIERCAILNNIEPEITVPNTNSIIRSAKKDKQDTIADASLGDKNTEHMESVLPVADKSNTITSAERRLTDIFVYPVKSCAAFKTDKWPLSNRGLLYDREWMIVTESGVALSLKRENKLCMLQPSIDLDLQLLILNYPGMTPVSVPLSHEKNRELETSLCNSKVCGDRVQSIDCGQVVSDWLSEVLGRPGCRLIRQKADDMRKSKLKQSDNCPTPTKLTLANESQYLLLSRASVDFLRDKIQERCESGESTEPIDSDNLLHRFRGNLAIDGSNPFEEENWKTVQIGNTCFKSQGSCTRCQMVCIDPSTGETSKEPLKTLAVWQERKMKFGLYLCCTEDFGTDSKTIQVGDPVLVF